MKTLSWVIARLEALEVRVMSMITSLVEYRVISQTDKTGADLAKVTGNPSDRQRSIRRTSPWGLAGYPPPGLLAAIVKVAGGALSGLSVGYWTDKFGPTDLKEGETTLYAKAGQSIKLDQDGNVIITPAGSGIVKVAGDAHPLPLWDSFEADLNTALGTILASNGGGNILSDMGTAINALRTKLSAHNYDSTKAKNS